MLLTDLNARGGIGANCLLLQFDGLNILIDAGLHPKEVGLPALPRFDLLRNSELDLIFLTHCHLDHLGALPVLARDHPDTPIVMSRETEALFQRMLQNSCRVMERQRDEMGIADYPLYAYRDINACTRRVLSLPTGQTRHFEGRQGDRITFTLHRAGHIPGAVGILFEFQHRRVFHTGDALFEATTLIDGASFPEGRMDTVILETTRGSTARTSARQEEMVRLINCIRETTSHGGSILIPVFALGRMQELIAVLHRARAEGRLPHLPLYLSGLGIDILKHFDRLSREGRTLRVSRQMLKDLGAEKLPERHHAGSRRPGIYLLSSGMMVENTPSFTTAASLLGSPQHTIAFVGYCDPDTPGGRLLKAASGERFHFGKLEKQVRVRAKIEKFDLSSHADREALLAYALERQPRSVVLSHGDPEAREWFTEAFAREDPSCEVVDPVPLRATRV